MNIGASMIKIAVTGLLLGGTLAAAPAGATGMVQMGQAVPQVAQARFTGHHDPRAKMDISMALQLRNQAGLETFLHQLQERGSPNYHKFLTRKQFTAAYGPTVAQVNEVKTYLQQHGFTVTRVSPGRTRIHATASTAAVESAFGVAVNDYSYQGGKYYAATTGPSLPSNIAGLVTHVFGLENMVQYRSHMVAPDATQGVAPRGYSPQQIATAYGWPKLTVPAKTKPIAAGVTIAIATAYDYRTADVQKFWSAYGLPSHTLTNIPIDGVTTRLNGETTLDVEHSSAMSPGSAILVYESVFPGNQVFDDMFQQIADDNAADVVSTSWGLAEQDSDPASVAAEHASFEQMTAEGMVFFAAAGDDGTADRSSGNDNADFPSSDPLTVAAGGTKLVLNDDGTIASETAWTDIHGNGSTGGADSILFAQPFFQTDTTGWTPNTSCVADTTPDLGSAGCAAASDPSRQGSDLSMDADPDTSYSFYYNGRWSRAGGTSFVAPQLAGMFAILTARLRTAAADPTDRVGQGNPVIYFDASINASDFNDITVGNNGLFNAGTGWDHPTGWGTPHNADTFINNLVAIMTGP